MTTSARTAEEAKRLADEREEAGDMEGATAAISEAIALEQSNPKYRALRGRLLHLRERWQDAIQDFDSALMLKPNSPTTLYFRARSRSMAGDLDGAILDFERCIELQPTSADAYAELGHINRYKGNLIQARTAYQKSLELDPERYAELNEKIGELEQKINAGT